MAPELLNPDKYGEKTSRPTKPADIYAFGMVIYEVLTGYDPFYDQDLGTLQLVCRVVNGLRPTRPSNAEDIGFGSGTWGLVKECWREKSKKRPTVERVLAYLAGVAASSATVCPSRSRVDPEPGTPNPGHVRFQLPPDHIDLQTVLSQWRRLGLLDPRSNDYDELLRTLVGTRSNRKLVARFGDSDAGIVINIIGEVSSRDTFDRAPSTSYTSVLPLNTRLLGAVDSRKILPMTASECFTDSQKSLADSQIVIWSTKVLAFVLKMQFSPAAGSQTFGKEYWPTSQWP